MMLPLPRIGSDRIEMAGTKMILGPSGRKHIQRVMNREQ
jgi:hypothetical protein